MYLREQAVNEINTNIKYNMAYYGQRSYDYKGKREALVSRMIYVFKLQLYQRHMQESSKAMAFGVKLQLMVCSL